jgi:hypothetical protein
LIEKISQIPDIEIMNLLKEGKNFEIIKFSLKFYH